MNDRNKHKETGQLNHQTADLKANASVFLFFPTAQFLKAILASRTNGTFGFAPTHKAETSQNQKSHFCQRNKFKTVKSLQIFITFVEVLNLINEPINEYISRHN